ncbi:MAG TPA: LacI family DNA-binding transcriptional regulator [Candidatus Paceibacterota bacterium]|nr:LacI family DNA-binding transcriptional regulator [Candidatus Paceibacterota bacterium]
MSRPLALGMFGFMRVTLRDIASKVGVSHSTVVMALRNNSSISVERRRQIRRVAKKLGYKPDPFLSGLAAYSRTRVPPKERGVLAWVNHWKSPRHLRQFREFQAYWKGASEAAKRFGYRVDEVRWGGDCSPKRLEKILLARGIEGVLIPPHHELLEWEDFDWGKFSVLRFGMSAQNPDSNQVTSDVFRGIVMAVTRFHEYGYRRIGFTVNEAFNARLGGNSLSGYFYSQKLLDLSPPLPPLLTALTTRNADDLARGKEMLKRWLGNCKPDAILTSDIEVPAMLRDLGFAIGKDIAVAGTSVLDIPLDAGIDQRSEAVGRVAVEMLVKQININERGEPSSPCRIMVESRWRDGASLPPKS